MPDSVWLTAQTCARVQRSGRYLPDTAAHPAKMLPAIAAHAVTHYTRPGDLVLDPMCGTGTTLVEAAHLGRIAVGVEYEPRWARIALGNLQHATRQGAPGMGRVFQGDARDLLRLLPAEQHGQVALVVTSPPYGNSVHGQVRSTRETGRPKIQKFDHRYGTDRANLAHVGTDRLLDAFTAILTQCRHALRPGGTAVITARPWRERGELVDLPTAVLAAGEAAGLIPTERCVALLAGIRDGRLITRPSFFQLKNLRDARAQGLPLHLIAHEDTLIFRRPNAGTHCTAKTVGAATRRCKARSATTSTAAACRTRTCAQDAGQ
ncbi:TRM11 family SAM-dependent methyltransferase [Actinacidiphila sp. bgisy167]|uniref:TRM11 family SAM-dependent methyltransferase n=1 Tax=Actinacidiphila sp. bgisy167 TaxID=3413797 RepID=UPI003D753F83